MESIEERLRVWDDPSRSPDTLDRSSFADRICESLESWVSSESLIIAIYGPWGSGKTWLRTRIEEKLENSERVSVCRFSPWQFESNEQITTEFFVAVLKTLEKIGAKDPSDKSAGKRAALFKLLGQIVTVGQLGLLAASNMLGDEATTAAALGSVRKLFDIGEKSARNRSAIPSLSELRRELIDLFASPDAPAILVTIDDLDRLEDEQIRMILRLIKATANFPNLNYLLLGERGQMSAALDPISGNAGDRYLEKVIQIPLTLPHASESEIRGRLWDGMELIARDCNYDIESQIERFESFWRQFFRSKLKHHRSVHRLLTITAFHCRSLVRDGELEVDLLDLVGIDSFASI